MNHKTESHFPEIQIDIMQFLRSVKNFNKRYYLRKEGIKLISLAIAKPGGNIPNSDRNMCRLEEDKEECQR